VALLDQGELDALSIDQMIFHVVGPEDTDLQLMDVVDIRHFGAFFLERIRETNIGNRFTFIGPDSGVRPALLSMHENRDNFVEKSKELAKQFHNNHIASTAKGAFIVASLRGLDRPVFALIKFDDQKVLRFRQERTTAGGMKAIVSEVDNTFVEDRRAMQKSAFIVLDDKGGGELAVYDRANKTNITDYFKIFLGVNRRWSSTDATRRFSKALDEAYRRHQDRAPDQVKQTWRMRLYHAVQNRDNVEPGEDLNQFGATVFGTFWEDERFRAEVNRTLHSQRISDEAIIFDKTVIQRPQVRRYTTRERLVIQVPHNLVGVEDVFHIEDHDDGSATITIRTESYIDDGYVAEQLPPRT